MNEGPRGPFKICNPREGLCLLKSKSNSADLFPLAAAHPSTSVSCTIAPQSVSNSSWSIVYLCLHCCLKRSSPVTPLCHLIPDLLLLFFFKSQLTYPFLWMSFPVDTCGSFKHVYESVDTAIEKWCLRLPPTLNLRVL